MEVRIVECLQRGPLHFNELGHISDAANAQLLARTLRRLMRDGVVSRRVIDASPPRTLYTLITATQDDAS